MKYKKLTLGQIEAVINKLGGEEEIRNFLAGKFIFLKQEVEQKVRMLSRRKVFNFVRTHDYQDFATLKGILFLSDDNLKELFYSLVEEKFPELPKDCFLENKKRDQKENTLNETIISIGDVTPTRIAQEIFSIMKRVVYHSRSYQTYEWFFLNDGARYRITFSFMEEKGSLREIYLMNCYQE
jgi:hypothetical protein